jgi:aminopeptidase N
MARRILPFLLLAACAGQDIGNSETGVDDIRFRSRDIDSTLPDVDALGYEIDLVVDDAPKRETFRGDVKGTYVATKALETLSLDFVGHEVDEVTVSGRAAQHRRDGDRIIITLPSSVAVGSTFSTRIRYHGDVAQAEAMNPDDFVGFGGFMVKQKNAEGKRIYTTMSWPSKTRRWLPVRDHPRDTAMVAIRATFPRAFTVLANGKQTAVEENDDGTKTWSYEALTPMPTYDFHVAAYEKWTTEGKKSAPITVHSYPTEKNAARVYADVEQTFDFFEATFGPYRWGTLRYVEEPIFGGGMEHATVISMDETLFSDPAEARATAFHELAHHWSGNAVHFRRWNDFWLSEGFTEYLTGRAIEHLDGDAAGRRVWRDYLKRSLEAERETPHPLAPRGSEIDVLGIFDATSYQRGALTVRMLRHMVGEAKMDAFLKSWFERHSLKAAVTTDDLQRELEAVTNSSLEPFFDRFVHGEGHPELRATISGTTLTIEQLQEGAAFRFPIDVAIGDKTMRVELTGKSTKVGLDAAPNGPVLLDPGEHAIAVFSCGQSGGSCRDGFRCAPQHEGVSACIPE